MSASRLSFGLSRQLWIVQVGIFLNHLGWGAVLLFEIIYLHEARGFSLGVAGLVVGTVTGLAVVAAPVWRSPLAMAHSRSHRLHLKRSSRPQRPAPAMAR